VRNINGQRMPQAEVSRPACQSAAQNDGQTMAGDPVDGRRNPQTPAGQCERLTGVEGAAEGAAGPRLDAGERVAVSSERQLKKCWWISVQPLTSSGKGLCA
jgi:hypothetical protein